MVPTITSRRIWAQSRGVQVHRVNKWFHNGKPLAKQAGNLISEETYVLNSYLFRSGRSGRRRDCWTQGRGDFIAVAVASQQRVKIGRSDLDDMTRPGDRTNPPPDPDDSPVTVSSMIPRGSLKCRKNAYNQVSESSTYFSISTKRADCLRKSPAPILDTNTYTVSLSDVDPVPEVISKLVCPLDKLLLLFTPDSDQENQHPENPFRIFI